MVNEKEIKSISDTLLKYFHVHGHFKVNADGSVNVMGHVRMRLKSPEFPVTFNTVLGHFVCVSSGLTTLKGAPKMVKGSFNCDRNQLTHLEFGPTIVELSYLIRENPLKSLDGFPEKVSEVFFTYQPHLPLLRLLAADKIHPEPDHPKLEEIFKRYAGQDKSGAIPCCVDLVRAGLKGNASW